MNTRLHRADLLTGDGFGAAAAPLSIAAVGAGMVYLNLLDPAAPRIVGSSASLSALALLAWNAVVMTVGVAAYARCTGVRFGSVSSIAVNMLAVIAMTLGVSLTIAHLFDDGAGTVYAYIAGVGVYWALFAHRFDVASEEMAQACLLTTGLRWASYLVFFVAQGRGVHCC